MIESNNPEINVDELMVKIREEVARRRTQNHSPFPSLSQTQDSAPMAIKWSGVNADLQAAEYQAQHIGDTTSEWLHFGRIKRKIARQVGHLILYLSKFIINKQKQFNWAALQSLRTIVDGLRSLENRVGEQVRHKDEVYQTLGILRETIGRIEQDQGAALQRLEAELTQREERTQGVAHEVREVHAALQSLKQEQGVDLQRLEVELTQREERTQGLAHEVREVHAALQSLKQEQGADLQRLEVELTQREERTQGLAQEVREVHAALQSLKQEQGADLQRLEAELIHREEREKELEKALYQLKVSLVQQERRTTLLLEEARKRLPAPFDQQQLQTFLNEDQHRLDALYVSFEDQFRGTREDIKERLRVYLPLLKENGIGAEHMPILDLGCGRGEWLELLREEGLPAQGVDINRVLIEQCRQQDFKVTESDALAYLRKLPDRSVGAVTGFHIIEHLSLQNLIQLLDETVRVLAPDGVAIFETPNPQNIMVGSCNFYLDPTHQRPLPSTTIKFLAEARGLCRVEVLNLHPYPAAFKVDGTDLAERFNEFFYGPQDYAVVGWKA